MAKNIDHFEKYLMMAAKAANDYGHTNDLGSLYKSVYNGVRAGAMKPNHDIITSFEFYSAVIDLIGQLTPRELINIFPIEKTYDGDRWECKDYFYTMKAMQKFGLDKLIGAQAFDILWEYENEYTRMFLVRLMGIMSNYRKSQGEKGIMEEFLDNAGIEAQYLHEDAQGKEFLVSKSGSVTRVRRPRHLKAVN